PDGRQIASAGADGMIRIWDFTAPPAGPRFSGPTPFGTVAFSGDGQRLTAVGIDLYTWDLTTSRQMSWRGLLVDGAPGLSPDGRYLAGPGVGRQGPEAGFQTTFLLEVASGREVFVREQRTFAMAFSPDGRLLAEGLLEDGSVRVTDVGTGRVLQSLRG